MADSLPEDIVQSIAIANAKSIGEQPAILANMALANQILNVNMSTQIFISQQQAMNQIMMATMAKAVSVILGGPENGQDREAAVRQALALVEQLQQQFKASQDAMQNVSQANAQWVAQLAEQLKPAVPAAPAAAS